MSGFPNSLGVDQEAESLTFAQAALGQMGQPGVGRGPNLTFLLKDGYVNLSVALVVKNSVLFWLLFLPVMCKIFMKDIMRGTPIFF